MPDFRAEERAYGKVNLGLAVLTRRGDGFHELETLMVPLSIYDDVVVTVSDRQGAGKPAVSVTGTIEDSQAGAAVHAGGAAPKGADTLVWDETNLVHKAATAYLNAIGSAAQAGLGESLAGNVGGDVSGDPTGIVSGDVAGDSTAAKAVNVTVHISVTKRLPVAAGMGGGSSDAAAVLRALNAWDAAVSPDGQPKLGQQQLAALALDLGSDVPFFLAQTSAVARGRGERLTLLQLEPLHLVLVNPGIPISAGEAYGALVGYTPRLREGRALQRMAEGQDPGWSNGLQPGVLRLYPELRSVMAELRAADLKGVLMSGSGSTCFGVAASAEAAKTTADSLAQAHPDWWVRAVHTV